MQRRILIASLLASYGVIAHAQSSMTLYGVLDAGVSYVNNVATPTGHSSAVKYGDGVAQGNRWGMKGVEDLGGGLRAIFTLESGFNTGDGKAGQGGALFGRQTLVGFSKEGIGSLTFGRQYSFSTDYLGSNYSAGGLTAAGNYAFHINDLDQLSSSRINNSVKFSSANVKGLTVGALFGFSNGTDFAGSPATAAGAGSSSAYSFGANYSQGTFGIGAAYTNIRFPRSAAPQFSTSIANVNTLGPTDLDLRSLETYGLGARYALGSATIWGLWTHTNLEPLTAPKSRLDNLEAGLRYAFTPALSASLGYTYSRLYDNLTGHWNQINSSLDYALSKRTDVYLLTIYQKASGSNVVGGRVVPVQAEIGSSSSLVGNSGTGADNQFVARVGLRTKF
ncbi:porin [Pararobbsia alpina]|uniref:Outer membrane porin protein n=1 Tax=Pararobbsia alpina TaxID=621374 RepID=A0A6S7BHA4_9BURK|nr:porin [Pararobbsia alpina]CAB3799963.1 Outer membrane porin protein [Pararobbsia alpina]